MSRRSNEVQFIDTYPILAPTGRIVRRLYSDTDPDGVHYSRAGKQEVLSKIVATLLVAEDQAEKTIQQT